MLIKIKVSSSFMSINQKENTNIICKDLYTMDIYKIFNDLYLISSYDGSKTVCKIYNDMLNLISFNEDNKNICGYQNTRITKTLSDNIKRVKDYETAINKAITALNNLKNNGSFSKNANNSNVQTQIAEINALISQLSTFGQTVRGALSSGTVNATQFANLSAEMSTLQSKFDSITSSAKAFQTELRQTNGQDAQEQKNKILIAQLEAYAVANSKAMKSNQTLKSGLTPSQEINNMLTALKAGADSSDWSKIQSNFIDYILT